MKMRSSSLFIAVVLLLISLAPCAAAFRPPVLSQPSPQGARVTVNGRVVASVRASAAELVPLDRAERLVANLNLFLDAGGTPWELRAAPVATAVGAWAVFGGDLLLITVTPQEAAAHRTTPPRLARAWARAIRAALALPPLTLSARQVTVPYGERRTVHVGGVATGPLTVSPEDPSVVEAAPRDAPRALVLRGLSPGLTAVRVEADGAALILSVRVRKYAGAKGAPPVVEVTGRPAPGSLVRQLALARYQEGLRLEPGARVRLLRAVTTPRALPPGAEVALDFPVAITGEGYLPVRTTARVSVRNRVLPHRETHTLLYSNNPERITRPELLYLGDVLPDAPARLLYHHQNGSGRPLLLRIDLYNPGEQTSEAQVIEGVAGPSPETILVGHRAALRYFQAALREIGQILSIPPGARRSLLVHRLADGWTGSGLFHLRVLSGGRLLVRVAAEEPDAPLAVADTRSLSEHVYPQPRKQVEASYTVGQRWAFVNLGRSPVSARDSDRRLAGNYGVLYDISLRLENPTEQERTVQLVLSPDAGFARGVFVIDGQIVEAPKVTAPAEAPILRIKMKPAEQRTLSIRTMPVGGSAYPVSLVVRP